MGSSWKRAGTLVRGFVALEVLLLGAIGVVGAWAMLPGIGHVPRWIAGTALGLGLLGVLAVVLPTLGRTALVRALAVPVSRWIEPVRPFQFAAVALCLGAAAVERLPRWIPALLADARNDWALKDPGETIVVWTVLSVLILGIALLLVAFGAALVAEALGVAPPDRGQAANTVMLWNVLVTVLAVTTETTDLFAGTVRDPHHWRWWLDLAFSLAVARSTLVVWVLFASEKIGEPMDAALAPRALSARIGRAATVLGWGLAVTAFVALEHVIGVAAAGALIAVGSGPLAGALERVRPAGPRAPV